MKRGYEGHEEALRTGAKILFDPLEHAATTTTQDLQVLVGGPGMSLTELFTRHVGLKSTLIIQANIDDIGREKFS